MRPLVFDIEGNGLLDTITKVHCVVAEDLLEGKVFRFYQLSSDIPRGPNDYHLNAVPVLFKSATQLICHNPIGYDLDVLVKFFDIDVSKMDIIDTLVWSQALNPDRKMPPGCPTVVGGKKIGPHSLHAWGYRVARMKPEHHDWTTFTPAMLHRCEEDVAIQRGTFDMLLEEAGLTREEVLK